jgi:hypothetical protein
METQHDTNNGFPFSPIQENTDAPQNVVYQKFTITICIIIVLLVVGGIFLLASKNDQPDTDAPSGNQLTKFDTKSSSKSVAGASTESGTYGPPEPSGSVKTPAKKPIPTEEVAAPLPTTAPTATPQPTSAPAPTATPTPTPVPPTATPTPTSEPTPTEMQTPTPTP